MRNFNVQPSYASKTNEQASLRCSWLQGRTLTSTWGKSRGWFKRGNNDDDDYDDDDYDDDNDDNDDNDDDGD
ncbi:hypothetical protein M0802_016474 [Mischocyttarus mexicanus]|nr:hypothetical protein M0802_016474 [Mischocyttarus mexicanus]